MERVETKYVVVSGEKIMATNDEKWFRMLDIIKILNNNLIYTIAKMLEEVGAKDISEVFKSSESDREYKFVNIENLIKSWDKNKTKLYDNYQNAKTIESSVRKLNFKNIKYTDVESQDEALQKSIDIIVDELTKISKFEKKDTKLEEKLEKLEMQLKLSNAKYDELREVNLKLIKERDALLKSKDELQLIKSTFSNLFSINK